MVANEEDYLMRQLKIISEAGGLIAKKLKLISEKVDFGEVETQAGKVISGADYVAELVETGQYQVAFLYLQGRKMSWSFYESQVVADSFAAILTSLPADTKAATGLTEAQIENYRQQLKQL